MNATDSTVLFPDKRPYLRVSRLRYLVVVAFVVASLAGGAFLRFHNIGKFGFWTDEFFHVFAAQSYNRDGSMTVPMHGEYTRAWPITLITAWSFRHFGVSEASARAPFAAFNLLFIVVSYFVIRRFFGLMPALATLGVLSFAPFMIHMSRECRMYTVFQLTYFLWQMVFLRGFEPDRKRTGWEGRLDIDARWLALSLVLLPVSLVIHDLTMNGGLVIAGYVGIMFLWEGFTTGWKKAAASKYGLCVALLVLGIAAALVFRRDDVIDQIKGAFEVPDWATVGRADTSFYRYLFGDGYPVLFYLYPLAAFAFVRAHGRRGLYVVVSFALLYLLHSYVFGRKGDRYIFYIFPYFVLVSAAFAARLMTVLAANLRRSLSGAPAWISASAWLAVLPAAYLVAYPWLATAARMPDVYNEIDWKSAVPEIRARVAGDTVIDTSPMPYLYYLGSLPDFYFLGEVWDTKAHAGRLVMSPADLEAAIDKPGTSVFVTDQGRIGNPAFVNAPMEAILNARTHMERSAVDPRIRYYTEVPAPAPKPAAASAPRKAGKPAR